MRSLILGSILLGISCSSTPDSLENSQSSEKIALPKPSSPVPLYPFQDVEQCWSGEIINELSECPSEPTDITSFRVVTDGNKPGTAKVWMNTDNILGKMELDLPNVTPPIKYELSRNLYRVDNQTQNARYTILFSHPVPVVGTSETSLIVGTSVLGTDLSGTAIINQSQTYRATKHDQFLHCIVNAVREHVISQAAPLDLVTNCNTSRTP